MPRFPGCQFGPFALRKLLRAHRFAGERLIGWGPARKKVDASTQAWIVAMSIAPGVGHGVAAMMQAQFARWVVLTDQRLLILSVDRSSVKPGERGLKADVSLGEAIVQGQPETKSSAHKSFRPSRSGSNAKFQISWMELGKLQALTLDIPAKAPASHQRLAQALVLLAQTSADAPSATASA